VASLTSAIGDWLGQPVQNELELANVVLRGLPLGVSNTLIEHGLTKEEFHGIVIPIRTFKHRKSRVEHLSPEESDRAVRTARVLAYAERVFADREKGLSWMRKAKKRFNDLAPMQMLQTEAGARLVEQMLTQIDDGMFA